MRVALVVLGIVLVSGQRIQPNREIIFPAVLLASNAKVQQQEIQQQETVSEEGQTQFSSSVRSAAENSQSTQSETSQDSRFGSQNQDQVSSFQQGNQQQFVLLQQQLSRQNEEEYPTDGIFESLNLPSGAFLLMGQIDTSFTCADRPYGYYADETNDCRIFHVCNPYLFDDGRVETLQYSFMCNEYTVFDQKELNCVEQSAAIPCQESSFHYSRNEEFGLPEEKL